MSKKSCASVLIVRFSQLYDNKVTEGEVAGFGDHYMQNLDQYPTRRENASILAAFEGDATPSPLELSTSIMLTQIL